MATAGQVRLSRGRREARLRMTGSLARSRARPISLARLRLWGTEADWAVFQGIVAWGSSRSLAGEGGGDDVNAGAAGGGVEDEAGDGVGVVGDLGALVGGEGDGGVGVAGGDDGEAAGGEQGAEAGGEGEGEVFFEEVVGEVGSGVGASVGGVEEDEGAGGGLLGEGKRGDQQAEREGECYPGRRMALE